MKFLLIALTYFLDPKSDPKAVEFLWQDTIETKTAAECDRLGERYKQLVESAGEEFEVRYYCVAYIEGSDSGNDS